MADLNIVVAGFNSTCAESHKEHFGYVGEQQYRWFAERLHIYWKKGWLRIGALHHNVIRQPVNDEANLQDANDLRRYLGNRLNLLLHRHTHQNGIEWLNEKLPILATGSSSLATKQLPNGVPNQYQIVRLHKGGFERWCRGYLLNQKRWGSDSRCSDSGNEWYISKEVPFKRVMGTFSDPPFDRDWFGSHTSTAERNIKRYHKDKNWWELLRLTTNYAQYLEQLGNLDRFHEIAELGLTAATEIDDSTLQALHAAYLGWYHLRQGDFITAETELLPYTEINGGHEQALVCRTLSLVLYYSGKLDKANGYARKAFVIWERLGDEKWKARALGTLGLIAMKQAQWGRASEYLTRALVVNRSESAEGIVMNLADIAKLYFSRGEFEDAKIHIKEALEIASLDRESDRYGYALIRNAQLVAAQIPAILQDALRDLNNARAVLGGAGWRIYTAEITAVETLLKGFGAGHYTPPTLTPMDSYAKAVQDMLIERKGAEPLRRASLEFYINRTPAVFAAIKSGTYPPPPPPLCVQLEITNVCTNQCKMCFRWRWPKSTEMSTEDVKNLLTELGKMGVRSLILSGGEPTAHPDFTAILTHAHEQGLHVGILSNGIWKNPQDVANAITQYADWVRISMDGSNAEVYKKIRGDEGGVKKIEEALLKLQQAKGQNSKCRIGIAYTIQKDNITDVEQMVHWAERCKALENEPDPVVIFKLAHGANSFLCSKEQLQDFSQHALSGRKLISHERVDLRYYSCFTPYLFSLVDAFGDVYVCCHLYDDNGDFDSKERQKNKLGNVLKTGFQAVWTSQEYRDMRSTLRRINVVGMPKCGECTRHYAPNAALTGLYQDIYNPLLRKYSKSGHRRFERIVEQYQDEVVWF